FCHLHHLDRKELHYVQMSLCKYRHLLYVLTGEKCGYRTLSGASCFPSFYWSSCSYGDLQPIIRGRRRSGGF
ncbi:hypothetical protein XENOCAPTIV_004821, partial [Xenoophorus captivus]